jgi:ribosomal protein S18 acetylase RimI-like enzyme
MASDSPVSIRWQSEVQFPREEIARLLAEFGDYLPNPIKENVDVNIYARKLVDFGEIILAFKCDEVVGVLGFYANDTLEFKAYISIVSVSPSAQGIGIGKEMVLQAVNHAVRCGMTSVGLLVLRENFKAIRFYEHLGFSVDNNHNDKIFMKLKL